MRRKTLLGCLVMLMASSQADAQRYFARQKLVDPATASARQPGCDALAPNTWSGGGISGVGTATNRADAQIMCRAAFNSQGIGSCTWIEEPGFSDTFRVFYSLNPATVPFPTSQAVWGAVCK